MIVAEHGDFVTLYCVDTDEILEFAIGDNTAPSFEKECLGQSQGFKFSLCGEYFELQFIDKKHMHSKRQYGKQESTVHVNPLSNTKKTVAEVHVYYQLTNRCVVGHHRISPVTLKCMDYRSNREISVNAFHCQTCRLFFINYEAIQDMMKKNKYPAINLIVHSDEINLKPFSKLKAYGYTVQSNLLSDYQRHNILLSIIDNGLMTKQEIIRDLEFKISYNGKRKSNTVALNKWKSDLMFISNYTSNNNITVQGVLIPR